MNNDSYVNVVFATDEEYLPITAVAMTSLAANYKDARRLRVFVLVDRPMPEDDANRFSCIAERFDIEIYPLLVSAEDFSAVRTSRGISAATYFRLGMHLVLPSDLEKVVYLDSDMIILGNIAEVFDTVLDDRTLFAGAEDYNSVAHRKSYKTPPTSVNLNAGVLVCNIKAIRAMDFLEEVSAYIEQNRYLIFHGDQQILNYLFAGRMKYIHIRWNMHGQLFEPDWVASNLSGRALISPEDAAEGRKSPSIIHYNGAMKPWNGGAHPRRRDWYRFARLSTYNDIFFEPSWPVSKTKSRRTRSISNKIYRTLWLDKLSQALTEGYRAKGTRTWLDRNVKGGKLWKQKPFDELRVLSEKQSLIQMHTFLTMRGLLRRDKKFSAADFVRSIPRNAKVYANAPNDDLEGGFHENIKLIFQTPNVGMKVLPYEADFSLVLHMAIRTSGFWDALLTGSFDREIVFGEAAFFGAYAGYFDKEAPTVGRRPFGYILDDLCYYYDARQPSRLELKLNDNAYRLSDAEIDRAKRLIKRIRTESLTKYNRNSGKGREIVLEPGSVVAIDQTPHDASIRFGGAEKRTITDMVAAAVRENPGATVYFKRHPDNVKTDRNILPSTARVKILPDDADITQVLDQCAIVYVVASQVGFEALLRGKKVVTFGMPFYSGWGLTDDRQAIARRTQTRTAEELFHAACIDMSVYVDPVSQRLIEIEDAFDLVQSLRRSEIGVDTQSDFARAAAE
ncbi:glycosyltransferase [Neorhizobium sp. DAR64861/K0K2]|uniref:glycosyltransferase n=1 Tax=unclassified Neorhizobium TaxID=2629175 RepID=UPI003D29E393